MRAERDMPGAGWTRPGPGPSRVGGTTAVWLVAAAQAAQASASRHARPLRSRVRASRTGPAQPRWRGCQWQPQCPALAGAQVPRAARRRGRGGPGGRGRPSGRRQPVGRGCVRSGGRPGLVRLSAGAGPLSRCAAPWRVCWQASSARCPSRPGPGRPCAVVSRYGHAGAARTVVQIPALAQRERPTRSPALIVQKSALTGQGSAPSDGGVTILPPDPDLDALRVTLARLRDERGWTFDELADRSGLARRTLIDLEHGRATGTVTTWHALAHAFDVPIEQLPRLPLRRPHPARIRGHLTPSTSRLARRANHPIRQQHMEHILGESLCCAIALGRPGDCPPASAVLAGVSPGTVPAMRPTPSPPAVPGTAAPAPHRRAARCGWPPPAPAACCAPARRGRCRHCGNRIDLYQRADGRPIALHPAELVTAHVPAACHWHLSRRHRPPARRRQRLVPHPACRALPAAHRPSAGSARPSSRCAANSPYEPAA